MEWLATQGATISLPVFHSPDYDVVADFGGELLRVQVKTCRRRTPSGTYNVMLETRGGNRSWSGVAKHFHPSRYDRLFVLLGDGRRWFIPSSAIKTTGSICLGGPKYAEYEVTPGRAFAQLAEGAR